MKISSEEISHSPSFRAQVMQYINAELVQGQLFGANEMSQEGLVEAYVRLEGKRRTLALDFILQRGDCERILLKVIDRVASKILSGEKRSDVRLEELRSSIGDSASLEIKTFLHFVDRSVANKAKRNKTQK